MGAFIFGFDNDDKIIFKRTVDFCNDVNLDVARFAFLTPLPGTKLFERFREEDRITTYDWSKYDLTHVIFNPKNMSVEDLQRGVRLCYHSFYSSKSIMKRVLSVLPKVGLWYSLLLLLVNYEFKKGYRVVF